MFNFKKQIEAQIQEIVFFFSLLIAFSLFISGVFFLTLRPESLVFILGQFGALIDQGLFSLFGYGFFYIAVASLHMGYVTNFHIFSLKDFKREWPVLAYSGLAHLIILALFSNLLSVIQIYLEIPSSSSLIYGSGGWIGFTFGSAVYAALGVYGSAIALLLTMAITALIANFVELNDVLEAAKKASVQAKGLSFKSGKNLGATLANGLQFFLKGGGEFSEATASSARSWASSSANKAKHLLTDHFHIYKREEDYIVKKEEKKEKAEKVPAKKTKNSSSKGLMNNLNMKKISAKRSSTKKTKAKTKKK